MTNLQTEIRNARVDLLMPHPWYAIRTKPNHEKTSCALLRGKGYDPYFPTYTTKRRWSDRVVESELALFPGYLFCRFDIRNRMPVITIPSVISILGFGSEPAPIPDHEIAAIETVLTSGLLAEPCPFLREGHHIRVQSGALVGLEGILLEKKKKLRLVVSVSLLQRSLAVEVDSHSITSI